jgi:hypothetical protein
VTAPAAILIARYFRSWRYWNYVHIGLNALTATFILIAFALANAAVGEEYTGEGGDLHHQLGLSIFIITLVQTVLGVGAAFTRHPRFNSVTLQKGRPALRFIHIAFGIATAAILCESGSLSSVSRPYPLRLVLSLSDLDIQVHTGFEEWDQTSESETQVPRGIVITFWVLLSVEIFAYIVGWITMEPLAWRNRKAYMEAQPDTKEATDVSHPIER